ncbi:inositol monophosphatase [Alicyclobacillus sp. TC]|nr:inositol monophosphatase [Alicyclobacillus sp. TC]
MYFCFAGSLRDDVLVESRFFLSYLEDGKEKIFVNKLLSNLRHNVLGYSSENEKDRTFECVDHHEKGTCRVQNSSISLDTLLSTAAGAALQAGRMFSVRLGTALEIREKTSLSDVVTEVDKAAEAAIRAWIEKHHPNHQVLGEEGVEPGREAAAKAFSELADEPHLWLVDPLDGTTNFVSGMPLSVVSIAYASHGKVQTACIYDPYRHEMFLAARGQGVYLAEDTAVEAWLEQPQKEFPGRRVTVSATTELRRAVVATGMPVRIAPRLERTKRVAEVAVEAKSFRALGAAALHLAYVAVGRIDAFWEFDLNVWDLAAGTLMVEEAGGTLISLEANPHSLHTRDILVAGKSALAERIYNIIQKPFD